MYNTLDLDKVSKEFFERVLELIRNCRYLKELHTKDTQKGYHVLMKCSRECDTCRFVFDDQKRYAMDFRRPAHKTNILFEPFSAHRCKT